MAGTPVRAQIRGAILMREQDRQGEKLNCEAAARAASTPWPGAPRLGQPLRDILDGSKVLALCPHRLVIGPQKRSCRLGSGSFLG